MGSPDAHVVADLAGLGPRFAAVVGEPPGWVPAGELFGERFDECVALVARGCGAPNTAVAGALLLQQYAALLVSPVVAAAAEGRTVACALADVRVELVDGRPVRLAMAPPSGAPLLDDHLAAVVETVHRRTRAGRRVLWGAIANAVAVAHLHLAWRSGEHARHVAAANAVLAPGGLDRLVGMEVVDVDGHPWMYTDRRTCCLAFRTAANQAHDEPYCATCPMVPAAEIRTAFEGAVRAYVARHR